MTTRDWLADIDVAYSHPDAADNLLRALALELAEENKAQAKRIEALERALEDISSWSDAYPLDVFPEPDFKKAQGLLEAGGMTLDSISASNMRHVVEGVGGIAKAALAAEGYTRLLGEHEVQAIERYLADKYAALAKGTQDAQ